MTSCPGHFTSEPMQFHVNRARLGFSGQTTCTSHLIFLQRVLSGQAIDGDFSQRFEQVNHIPREGVCPLKLLRKDCPEDAKYADMVVSYAIWL